MARAGTAAVSPLRAGLRVSHDAGRRARWDTAQQAVSGESKAAMSDPSALFIVERRLRGVSERQLAVLQAALTGAASRFSARGDRVWYLRSIFLARQERLLSLFAAESIEAVRAVNEAALVPFASIEPAIELPGLERP
jgi:hypothetical protein